MQNCTRCQQETGRTALVYVGSPVPGSGSGRDARFHYEPFIAPLCDDCVETYRTGFSGILFYAALQLGWFTVAQRGLFSPFGLLGAAVALLGLVRLGVKLLQRLLRGRDPAALPPWLRRADNPELEASDALRAALKKNARFGGKEIRSLREQNRVEGRY